VGHTKYQASWFLLNRVYSNRSTPPTYKNSHKSNGYKNEQETGECIVHNIERQDCSQDKLEMSCKAKHLVQSPTTCMLISCSPTLKRASHPFLPDLTNLGNKMWLDIQIPPLSCYCKYQSQTKQAVLNWVTLIAFVLHNYGVQVLLCIIVLHNSGVQLLSIIVLYNSGVQVLFSIIVLHKYWFSLMCSTWPSLQH